MNGPQDKLVISALQHFRFCKRQFALIHIERLWAENRFTAEGRLLHENTDIPAKHAIAGTTISRAMPLASECLGIFGVADTVEFLPDGTPFPVEYKRGRPNLHGSDEIQLCAQALCLEEMTKKAVPAGALFYGETRRRLSVEFTEKLRNETETVISRAMEMRENGETPPTEYSPEKCTNCSLLELCLPECATKRRPKSANGKNCSHSRNDEAGAPMKLLLNTLYITKENAYLRQDGEAVDVRLDGKSLGRFPLINLAGIVTLGWDIACSPSLMGACAERGIAISFLNPNGKFLASVHGYPNGNVLLRRIQYRTADDPAKSLDIARRCIQAKFANSRTLMRRAARETKSAEIAERLSLCANLHHERISEASRALSADELRGIEGDTAAHYFRFFNDLVLPKETGMQMNGRSRRPPRDPVNALLSFLYTLLAHDCRAACVVAGLDPQVGFYHADRPGRPGLALDLMEEFRSVLADRVALSLINRKQITAKDFKIFENGAVLLTDDARKTLLQVWQERKREEISHPVLDEKMPLGLVPLVQARLLARHLRKDYEHYLPFLWK